MSDNTVSFNTPDAAASCFFAPSTKKLAVMSILTFTFYEFYWFFKNWQAINVKAERKLNPLIGAFFSPFLAYACFARVRNAAETNGVKAALNIGFLALVYFLLQMSANLPGVFMLIAVFGFAPIIPVNNVAFEVNQRMVPGFKRDDKFSSANWLWIFIGGTAWIILIATALLRPDLYSTASM